MSWSSFGCRVALSELGHHLFGEELHGRHHLGVCHGAEGEGRPKIGDAVLTLESGNALHTAARGTEVEVVHQFRRIAGRCFWPYRLPVLEVHVDLVTLGEGAPVRAQIPHPGDGLLWISH